MLRGPSRSTPIARRIALAGAIAAVAACAPVHGERSTAPEAVTVESAAAAYVALVAPLNLRLQDIGERADAARTVGEVRRISDEYARLHDAYAAALAGLEVPPTVRDEVLAAADAAKRVAVVERRAALAPPTAFRAVGRELADALDDQRRVIDALRGALGLDPVT